MAPFPLSTAVMLWVAWSISIPEGPPLSVSALKLATLLRSTNSRVPMIPSVVIELTCLMKTNLVI